MAEKRRAIANGLLNVALAVLGLVMIVLLYALVTRSFLPRADATREGNPGQLVGDIIQVEVRNGCGAPGIAGEVTRFLRRRGFDVVEVGDHTSFDEAQTRVVDRVGDPAAARKVAAALGLPEDRIVQDIRPDYYLDASIILGRDYPALTPFADE
jgi:hypothetical protein